MPGPHAALVVVCRARSAEMRQVSQLLPDRARVGLRTPGRLGCGTSGLGMVRLQGRCFWELGSLPRRSLAVILASRQWAIS